MGRISSSLGLNLGMSWASCMCLFESTVEGGTIEGSIIEGSIIEGSIIEGSIIDGSTLGP